MSADGPGDQVTLLPLGRAQQVVSSGRWLLRMRWLAGLAVLLATWLTPEVLGIALPVLPLLGLGAAILLYNVVLWAVDVRLRGRPADGRVELLTHLQLALDWVAMTALISLTGGIESPLLYLFVLHVIMASLLFSRPLAAVYTGAAVVLVAGVALLEHTGLASHVHLTGFMPAEIRGSLPYLVGTLATFVALSTVSFLLTSSIATQARRREGQLAALYQGAGAITSTLELGEVLEGLARETVTTMGVQGASLGLVDASGTQIEMAASYGLSESYVKKGPLRLDPGFVQAEVLATGEPAFIQRPQDRRRLQYPAAVEAEGIRSILYVRLTGKNRPLGLMRVYSSEPEAFGPDDARFLSAIAAQGAAAIENALAFQTLRQLDAEKSKFVRLVTHELRAPVTGAQSLLSLILDGYQGPVEPRQRESLVRLQRRLQTLQALINDLLDLAAGRSGLRVGEAHPVSLLGLLRRAVAQVEPLVQEKHQTLALHTPGLEGDPLVLATGEDLDRVFSNLVGNAVKYTPEGGAIVVTVAVEDSRVAVAVADTGIGIPAKSLPRLFSEFYRAPNAKAFESGTGLGLVIVKELVERLGGRVAVESEEGKGSTFTVHLPRHAPRPAQAPETSE